MKAVRQLSLQQKFEGRTNTIRAVSLFLIKLVEIAQVYLFSMTEVERFFSGMKNLVTVFCSIYRCLLSIADLHLTPRAGRTGHPGLLGYQFSFENKTVASESDDLNFFAMQ